LESLPSFENVPVFSFETVKEMFEMALKYFLTREASLLSLNMEKLWRVLFFSFSPRGSEIEALVSCS